MRQVCFVGGVVLAWLCGGIVAVQAEPIWQRVSVFKKIASDPQGDYQITEENGPWMIMAVTFLGDDAQQQAQELVIELRTRYKLEAYTHAMDFDFSGEVTGRTLDERGRPARMKYRRDEKYHEIAVLVGNYPSVDDPQAQKTLEKLKYAQPECMQLKEGRKVSRPLAQWRLIQQELQKLTPTNQQEEYGPMGHAFITTNPLLPREYFAPKGLDPLVVKMNKDVEFSLLDCPSKYSVRVATFTGRAIVDPKKIALAEADDRGAESQLAKAALNAHTLTEALRAQGVEAYEFHDRYMSIVTVGSFDSVGTPRADGKIEINPQIHQIMERYGAQKQVAPGQPPIVGKPKSLKGVPFDVQPLPVEVPRQEISEAFTRRGLFD